MKTHNILFISLIISMVIMSSCSKPEEAKGLLNLPTIVNSIKVSPDSVLVMQGQSHQFSAVVNGTVPWTSVSWALAGNLVNETSINSSGLLIIADNEIAERLTITATSDADNSKSDTSIVSVPAIIVNVVVDPAEATLINGETLQFCAVVNGSNSLSKSVIWDVTGGVDGTNIDTAGLLTVAQDETAKSLTIKAISEADPLKEGIATLSIPVVVTSVQVSPASVILNNGETQQFSAVVEGSDNISQNVTWEVSGGVDGTSINPNGLLSIADSQTAGSLNVTAISVDDPNIIGVASVTIPLIITDLTVSPSTVSVIRGDSQQFTAEVNGSNNPPQDVIWTLTGNANSETSINNNGLLTVASNETSTSLTVDATSSYNSSISGTASVAINSGVTSVVVTPAQINLSIGESYQFSAVVNGSNNPPQAVDWSVSGNMAETNITSSGILQIATNETSETLVITATCSFDTSMSGNANVSVNLNDGIWYVTDWISWNTAKTGIYNMGNNKIHTINVNSDFSGGGLSGWSDNTFGNLLGIIIIIQGSHTISITSNGRLLAVGAQQTVIVKDVTLQGRNGNTYSLCRVGGNGSIFRMEGNAIITGNTTISEGGGCSVEGGTFIMKDNALITGNLSGNMGGGVCVLGGTFTMMDNATISENTVNTPYYGGGGVYVNNGGIFTMCDNSSIIGNTASGRGGGVSIGGGNGTFIMQNGTIASNSSDLRGGGLDYIIGGSFIKIGGTIYGNDAPLNLRNIATSGGHAANERNWNGDIGWRNITAGPADNTTTNNFWLND